MEMVQQTSQNNATDKSTRQYLRSKLSSAQWFINAIQQRENNMLKIMRAIVDMQYDYFKYGDILLLKPMKLKDIADKVTVDISTVSRLTCNKYAETPFGTILLKDLFTEGIVNQEGTNISNKVIQNIIGEVIEAEDKKAPYTDRQLVTILAERGYSIARRTVAKYRELMNIPVAQVRGLWN
jgi:RNA polymerase sigma-54 factor